MGARVIAAASTEEKLDLCRERGADETINYAKENLKERAKELTDGAGVDVIYDVVGGDYAEQALRAIGWGGRFLVIGFTAGIPAIPLNLTLLKSCQIIGVFYGAMTARQPDLANEIAEELLAVSCEWPTPSTYLGQVWSRTGSGCTKKPDRPESNRQSCH